MSYEQTLGEQDDVIDARQAERLVTCGRALLMDLRAPHLFLSAHIEGARSAPLDSIGEQTFDDIPAGQTVIAYGSTGKRSAESGALLRRALAGRVQILNGGINAWKAAGLPVVTHPLMQELARFEKLFEQLFEHTYEYLDRIKDINAYAMVPVDSSVNFLGTRVNKITIGNLLRHYIMAEAHWFESLAQTQDGGTIPFPQNADLLEGIEDGHALWETYRNSYTLSKQHLEALTLEDLTKTVLFANRRYTGLGLLWSILGHHGFHLGQIDLLMRQQNIEPPEYMEWPEVREVIA